MRDAAGVTKAFGVVRSVCGVSMQMRFVHKFFARMKQTVGTFFFFFAQSLATHAAAG